jgi:hypothetical protein
MYTEEIVRKSNKNMRNLQTQTLVQSSLYASIAAATVLAMLSLLYFAAEPKIGRAQADTADIVISQTITDESSITVNPAALNMDTSIGGLTGGTANGSSEVVVTSNNTSGYTVTIDFFDNAGSEAMYGNTTLSSAIQDYRNDDGAEPSYNFVTDTMAQFAYTVTSTTSTDTDGSFDHNGADTCNTAGTEADGTCWKAPSTTAFTIIDTSDEAPSGATSSVAFRVHVPNSPVPAVTADTYIATATLSLILK